MNQSQNTVGQRKHIEPVPDPRIGWCSAGDGRGEEQKEKQSRPFLDQGNKQTNKQTNKQIKKKEYCRRQKQARTLLDSVSLYRGKIHPSFYVERRCQPENRQQNNGLKCKEYLVFLFLE